MGSRLVMKHFAVRSWPARRFVVRRYITGLGSTPPSFSKGMPGWLLLRASDDFPKLACVSLRWNEIRIGLPAAVERGPS